VRLGYVRDVVVAHFGREPKAARPFAGLRFLDIGCGGGLLTEPMARLGASITGVDPSEKNIKTATVHAAEVGLDIDYRVGTAEDLAAADERFDVILNMEVIEHVADPAAYTRSCAAMLKPGGLMFVATLNRTLKSFGLAIVGAEYVLGWLPKGTHQWEKFITPEELRGWLAANQADIRDEVGVTYSPFSGTWRKSRDMAVNYMVVAEKSADAA
jgi:2-polyprenyl-6-hydroxyphenyl methylase/3-demethylubiquinone-9 3-methyltransferase